MEPNAMPAPSSQPHRSADAARPRRGGSDDEPEPPGRHETYAPPAERVADDRLLLLTFIRYLLPAAIVIVGLVFMAMGGENNLEGGASIVSAGLAIYFLNWLFRLGASGDRERENEAAAREYFKRHGRWPQ
jgi:hypothetical protein